MSNQVIEADLLSVWNVRLPIWWMAWRNIGEHQLFSSFGKLLYLYPSISLAHATKILHPFHWAILKIVSFIDTIPTQSLPRRVGLMRPCYHYHQLMIKLPSTSWLTHHHQIPIVIIQECQRALHHSWEEIKRSTGLPPAILATCFYTGHCYCDDDGRHLPALSPSTSWLWSIFRSLPPTPLSNQGLFPTTLN